jgi:small neutral amino acid transporter SnatA (MarC family)
MPLWVAIFFVFAGLFSFAGAVFDWEWFMTNRRALLFVRILGRNGARALYALLGIFLAVLGLAGAFGYVG